MTDQLTSLEGEAVGMSATSGVGIETCDTADGLAAVNRPDMQLVIWQRALPLRLQSWLDRMDASCLPDTRILVRPRDLRTALKPHLDDCGVPQGDMRDLLVRDVDDLVSTFSKVTQTDLVDVRLERVSHDACWKFHRDREKARLLTTYRGPATEWVQPIHGEWALHEQRRFKGPVEHLRVHDVAIFKGSCAGPGSGIVHRSPPIASTGRTRLLLCLNKRSAASPEAWSTKDY
ncbi:DUF1826 domain-containing protein [Algihabitans albus]|uniref:DUF1826 domain-containing protein n=1 Tax=Algihabitans albus TaxID=2164067 RepID=UPI000E5CE64C|nr:DUF1826 domain-containing protein [Algihabitans albus]